MFIHLVQFSLESLRPDANRARVSHLVRSANVAPGSMIVLPELFSTGTLSRDFDRSDAGAIARDDRLFLAALAREAESWIVAGVLGGPESDESTEDAATLRNLCLVFDPEGREISSYQKIHPFSLGGEDKIFGSGGSVAVTAMGGFTVLTAVCYDLRFPELFRVGLHGGAERGGGPLADLIVVPANWPASRREHWDVLLRARAIENQCYVAGVNCLGTQHGTSYAGGTVLVSPKGEVLAAGHETEGVVSAEISADHVRAWRRVFPALRDRKDEGFWGGAARN